MSGKGKKATHSTKPKSEANEPNTAAASSSTTARQASTFHAPSVQDILDDALTKISLEYWAPGAQNKKDFDPAVIDKIFNDEIGPQTSTSSRLMLLELSFYLEKYDHSSAHPRTCS
jgi:hypothetical protein